MYMFSSEIPLVETVFIIYLYIEIEQNHIIEFNKRATNIVGFQLNKFKSINYGVHLRSKPISHFARMPKYTKLLNFQSELDRVFAFRTLLSYTSVC